MTTVTAYAIFGELGSDGLFLDSAHEQSKFNTDVLDIDGLFRFPFLEHHTNAVLATSQPAIRTGDRNGQVLRALGASAFEGTTFR